jgi:hypothetical protein
MQPLSVVSSHRPPDFCEYLTKNHATNDNTVRKHTSDVPHTPLFKFNTPKHCFRALVIRVAKSEKFGSASLLLKPTHQSRYCLTREPLPLQGRQQTEAYVWSDRCALEPSMVHRDDANFGACLERLREWSTICFYWCRFSGHL